MKHLIIVLFCCSFTCFSQVNYKAYVGISQEAHPFYVFTETKFSFGTSIILNKGAITPLLQYQFGGNFPFDRENDPIKAYEMNYHFLGIGANYRFRQNAKIYSPTIKVTISTELTSNYKGKYLYSNLSIPYRFYPSHNYSINDYSGQFYPDNYVYYYVSTPLIGSISIGNEFRLIENLYLNVGIGYSFRRVNVRFKKWPVGQQEPEPNLSKPYSLEDADKLHFIDLSVGVNYTFPLKKE